MIELNVEDILLLRLSAAKLSDIKTSLFSQFKTKDLREERVCLEIHKEQNSSDPELTTPQSKYSTDVHSRF